ncbi:MAG TPA: alpha/beta hydrolase, partial [Pseudonocardiaceae bacterium]|nr:alpha/beta hydrolase [Pseudonocardiaceae bacterium]
TGVRIAEVSFVGSGGVVLRGSVVGPAAAAGRRPAVVMLSGAGNTGRAELLPEAEAFARHGIVTLVYDKRTVGYSLFQRDYSVLADDALAGLRLLRTRADVDPARVGLWALSEGAFVAPLVADRSTDVEFLITVGAVGVTPAEQTAWAYGEFLRHDGVSGSLPHMMQVTATRVVAGAKLFPEADFDPVPAWEHVRQPVLAQWGELDRQAVPVQSSQIIERALRKGGNTNYTIRFVPGTRHDLNLTADGGFDRTSDLSPDYGDVEAVWITALPNGPTAVSTAAPTQDQPSRPVTPLAWWESPGVQLAAILLFLVAFAGYPVTAVVRRLLGRRGGPPVVRPARWLAATGLASTVGFLGYLFFLLATAANILGVVVLGRPIPWLVLQILAVAIVVSTVVTAVQWRRHNRDLSRVDRMRLGLLVTAGFVFLPWAVYWGLLVP